MPYRRTLVARTPLLAWDQLQLEAAMPAWGPNYRPDSPRLMLPLERSVHCELDGQRFVLDAGTALWLTPHQAYRLRQPHAGQRSMVLVLDRPSLHSARRCRVALPQRWRLQRLAQQAAHGEVLAVEEGAVAWVDELLGDVAHAAPPPHPAVERAREYIASDPTRCDDLMTIARAAASSPFHLARLFRRHTGRGLHGYRDELRLVLALQRLQGGERSLAQLALELGYAHHSHFSAAFKRRFGLAPTQLRRNLTAPAA